MHVCARVGAPRSLGSELLCHSSVTHCALYTFIVSRYKLQNKNLFFGHKNLNNSKTKANIEKRTGLIVVFIL